MYRNIHIYQGHNAALALAHAGAVTLLQLNDLQGTQLLGLHPESF